MSRSLWEGKQRIDALLRMIAEDGATPAGQLPAAEHVAALREAPVGRAGEVADAHREGRGPPAFAGGDRQ